jgi:isopenicillin-N epimerase
METSRRNFMKGLGMGISALGIFGLSEKSSEAELMAKLTDMSGLSPAAAANDESFWFYVQQAFEIDRSVINLNNGGVHPAPKVVVDAVKRYMDTSNGAPVLNSWRYLRPRKELIRKKLADTFGCSPEEIAITRNVTESMQIALLGLDLQPGDEVLTTTHDYPSMKNALYQRGLREKVKVNTFSFPYPPKNLQVLADLFEKNVTSRTKLILLCHITNLTGQIFPVREICRMARKRGIEVVIDGAHAFAHFVFQQKDLDCDIYGANLHKWMMGPIGTGFLYVKKSKIGKIWPLFPSAEPQSDDIRKFEHVGTQPEALKLALGEALAFHHGIGGERKEERLRYLRNYWAKAIEKFPRIKILTSYDRRQSCGLGAFTVEGMDMGKLSTALFQNYKIVSTNVSIPSPDDQGEEITGMRISPSVYTTLRELDIFIEAVHKYVTEGLPG